MDKDNTKQAVILFADVINSSELANHLSLDDYCSLIVTPFQEIAHEVVNKYLGEEVKHNSIRIVGEELCVILYSETLSCYEKLLKAIEIARELKIRLALTPFNLHRIETGKYPQEIGVGINIGDVKLLYDKYGGKQNPEGYAINLAKRVENASHEKGIYTRIMFSRRAYQEALEHELKVSWSDMINVSFRGISQLDFIYEIHYFYGFVYWNLIEELKKDLFEGKNRFVRLFDMDYSNFWIGMELANCFLYQMRYEEAIDILKKLLLIRQDFHDALVLLGECYEQLGIRAYMERDKETCKLYFKRAEESFKKSISLNPYSEDIYVELGLLYYNWFRLIDSDNVKWEQAYEFFSKGAEIGVTHTRSAFWKWRLDLEKNRVNMQSMLLDLGWSVGREEELKQVTLIEKNIEKYLQLCKLPNYRATIYQSVACVYGYQFKQYQQAREWCDKAISEANLVLAQEGVYTTLGDYSGIVSKETFINHCREIKRKFHHPQDKKVSRQF